MTIPVVFCLGLVSISVSSGVFPECLLLRGWISRGRFTAGQGQPLKMCSMVLLQHCRCSGGPTAVSSWVSAERRSPGAARLHLRHPQSFLPLLTQPWAWGGRGEEQTHLWAYQAGGLSSADALPEQCTGRGGAEPWSLGAGLSPAPAWGSSMGGSPQPTLCPPQPRVCTQQPRKSFALFLRRLFSVQGWRAKSGQGGFPGSLRQDPVTLPSVLIIQNLLRSISGSFQTTPVILEADSLVWPQSSKNIRGN